MSNDRDLAAKLLQQGKIQRWELDAAASAAGVDLSKYLNLRKKGKGHAVAMRASR